MNELEDNDSFQSSRKQPHNFSNMIEEPHPFLQASQTSPFSQSSQLSQLPQTPGACLLAKRLELGWAIEDVATYLNMTPRQINALETDHYEDLPSIMITRGFIRVYAKLLKMDEEPLLAMLGGIHNLGETVLPAASQGNVYRPFLYSEKKPAIFKKSASIIGLLLILLLILPAYFFDYNIKNTFASMLKTVKEELVIMTKDAPVVKKKNDSARTKRTVV